MIFIAFTSLAIISILIFFPDVFLHYQHLFEFWKKPESGWFIGPFGWDNLEKMSFSLRYIFSYLTIYTAGYLIFVVLLATLLLG
ncbi:MAG: hypothetical protein QW738_09340, partial [Nitrososphaeria archaeon]